MVREPGEGEKVFLKVGVKGCRRSAGGEGPPPSLRRGTVTARGPQASQQQAGERVMGSEAEAAGGEGRWYAEGRREGGREDVAAQDDRAEANPTFQKDARMRGAGRPRVWGSEFRSQVRRIGR